MNLKGGILAGMIEKKAVFVRCSDVIERDMDGEAVLLNLKTGVYYTLNAVGSDLWNVLDGEKTVEEAVRWVMENYEVDPETAEKDVDELFQDLIREHLIEAKRQ